MAVFLGTPPADGFGRVPNDWMRDPKIKGLAKAVLAYLVGHRDGYKLTIKQMVAEFREGEDALYAAIKELIAAGYLKRVQRRGRGGVVGEVDFYVIGADGKFQQVATASGFSGTGKPGSGTTSNNAEFSQVATASGFTASGSTGSGESGTEKNNPKKTKDLKDEEKTTSSCAADPAGPRTDRTPCWTPQSPADRAVAQAAALAARYAAEDGTGNPFQPANHRSGYRPFQNPHPSEYDQPL